MNLFTEILAGKEEYEDEEKKTPDRHERKDSFFLVSKFIWHENMV